MPPPPPPPTVPIWAIDQRAQREALPADKKEQLDFYANPERPPFIKPFPDHGNLI